MVGSGKSILIGSKVSDGFGKTAAGYGAKSVPYDWVDMTNATEITDSTSPISYPSSSFPFYGTTNSQLFVNENGTITFGNYNISPANADLSLEYETGPSKPTTPTIAALWDSLGRDPYEVFDSKLLYKSVDVDQNGQNDLAIEWRDFYYGNDVARNEYYPVSFQAVLFADGRIRFNYEQLDTPETGLGGTPDTSGGLGATVAIWKGGANPEDPLTLPAGKFVPGPHSLGGQIEGYRGDVRDSYIRMAWDTGGAAWDIGIVDAFFSNGGINSPQANALRDAFIGSLAGQIDRSLAAGKVFRNGEVVLAVNYGGNSLPASQGGFAEDTGDTTSTRLTTATTINTSSNSIPLFGSPAAKAQHVFQSARTGDTTNGVNDDIQLTFTALANGSYVVELYFAEISNIVSSVGTRTFDVLLEGQTVLNDYDIFADLARIVPFGGSTTELDVAEIGGLSTPGGPGGVVKRFRIDVNNADGAAGLQIGLVAQTGDALINGIRILKTDPPRIENVVLKGSSWADGVDYSYAEAVTAGKQLAPMYRSGANRLEIHFDGPVNFPANPATALSIIGDGKIPISQTVSFVSYNSHSHVATWSLGAPFGAGKYALQLTGITGANGVALDGDWDNVTNSTPDDFVDDPKDREFVTGLGVSGGAFSFFFSVLPGDSTQDGKVTSDDADLATVGDINGDGVRNSSDVSLVSAIVAAPGYGEKYLTAAPRSGDYNDDETVELSDYTEWRMTFNSTVDLNADGNANGIVDSADYNVWRDHLNNTSAWYTDGMGGMGSGSSIPLVLFGVAPHVTNVVISGSNSTHDSYSFDAVDGSGEQLRTVPVGGADTISITFSEDVNLVASDLTLVGLTTANRPALAEFHYDLATMTGSWRFSGWTFGDHYMISLSDAVTDVEGNSLDGEWTNPGSLSTTNPLVSEFPSGNGTAGGDFNFVATLLPGDANLDAIVDSADLAILSAHYGNGQLDELFSEADFNGDGRVSIVDFSLYADNSSLNLQALSVLSDLDGDWDVDSDDEQILFDNFLANLSNPTQADGDLNEDGTIDIDDLDLMFAQYGLELSVES